MKFEANVVFLCGVAAVTAALWGVAWQLGLLFMGCFLIVWAFGVRSAIEKKESEDRDESKGFFTDTETTDKK